MALKFGINGDARPRGRQTYRHWLSRTWDATGPVALVIGINPNTATEDQDDGMTSFLTRLLRGLGGDYACGGFMLVNCCDLRHGKPGALQDCPAPVSPRNLAIVREKLCDCDLVVASWGVTDYGPVVENCRERIEALVRRCAKRAICFSPKGLPIYCGPTNANSPDGRWSSVPVVWV